MEEGKEGYEGNCEKGKKFEKETETIKSENFIRKAFRF